LKKNKRSKKWQAKSVKKKSGIERRGKNRREERRGRNVENRNLAAKGMKTAIFSDAISRETQTTLNSRSGWRIVWRHDAQ
jgi:hypothetical protein